MKLADSGNNAGADAVVGHRDASPSGVYRLPRRTFLIGLAALGASALRLLPRLRA